MKYKIKSNKLVATFNDFGAELISLKGNNNVEYIWQGNEKYWKGQCPVLFPFVGRLFEKKYIFDGNTYDMGIHGFAKISTFKVIDQKDNLISFLLKDNEETKKIYPFSFEFIVTYVLNENVLDCIYKVINKDNKKMYFSYGGHPGFNVPINGKGVFANYYIEFSNEKYKKRLFSENALSTWEEEDFNLIKNKRVNLNHNLFDNDAIFLSLHNGEDKVTLKSDIYPGSIELSFKDMTTLGLWHTNKTDAPFICIEPWHGFPGREGTIEDLAFMKEMIELKENEEYINSYSIKIN